jgi:hypothetical protein
MLVHQRPPYIRDHGAVVGAIAKQQKLKVIVSGLLVYGLASRLGEAAAGSRAQSRISASCFRTLSITGNYRFLAARPIR